LSWLRGWRLLGSAGRGRRDILLDLTPWPSVTSKNTVMVADNAALPHWTPTAKELTARDRTPRHAEAGLPVVTDSGAPGQVI
jgi:hypothetical protein